MKIHFDFAIAADITPKRLMKLGFKPAMSNQYGRTEKLVYVIGRHMDDCGNFWDTITISADTMSITSEYGGQFPDTTTQKVRSMRDVKQFLAAHQHEDEEAAQEAKYGKKGKTIDVWLIDCVGSRSATIMEVKRMLNMDLQLARRLVMNAPQLLKSCETAEEAEDIKRKLEATQAKIELR